MVTAVNVREDAVAPAIFVQVTPPSVLTCHCKVNPVPEAVTLKVALAPAHNPILEGCEVIETTELMAKVAALEFTPAGEQVPNTTDLY